MILRHVTSIITISPTSFSPSTQDRFGVFFPQGFFCFLKMRLCSPPESTLLWNRRGAPWHSRHCWILENSPAELCFFRHVGGDRGGFPRDPPIAPWFFGRKIGGKSPIWGPICHWTMIMGRKGKTNIQVKIRSFWNHHHHLAAFFSHCVACRRPLYLFLKLKLTKIQSTSTTTSPKINHDMTCIFSSRTSLLCPNWMARFVEGHDENIPFATVLETFKLSWFRRGYDFNPNLNQKTDKKYALIT